MIDWLELLWKATEEGQEFGLPGEPDLLPAKTGDMSRAEEDGETAPTLLFTEEPEPRISQRQSQRRLKTAEWLETAELLEGVEPTAEGSYLRSALRAVKRPVSGSTVQETAGSAVAALYHRVRETVSSVQPGIPGRGGTVVVREETPAAPGLTEERLDRSLRRDSRRYDGGMSIY